MWRFSANNCYSNHYFVLFPIDFAADVILPFIELLVMLLPAVIFAAPIFPLVWFPGIIVIANEVVATYTLIANVVITIAEAAIIYTCFFCIKGFQLGIYLNIIPN